MPAVSEIAPKKAKNVSYLDAVLRRVTKMVATGFFFCFVCFFSFVLSEILTPLFGES